MSHNIGDELDDVKKLEGFAGHSKTSVPDLNLKRRRLVRGVTAVAPLVLTLRSGALAAASCTGVKAINVSVGSNNKPASGIAGQDYCATQNATLTSTCVTPGQVTPDPSPIIGTNGQCFSNHQNQQVAILSAASVTSLIALR